MIFIMSNMLADRLDGSHANLLPDILLTRRHISTSCHSAEPTPRERPVRRNFARLLRYSKHVPAPHSPYIVAITIIEPGTG
jgi:hypothetical protein